MSQYLDFPDLLSDPEQEDGGKQVVLSVADLKELANHFYSQGFDSGILSASYMLEYTAQRRPDMGDFLSTLADLVRRSVDSTDNVDIPTIETS